MKSFKIAKKEMLYGGMKYFSSINRHSRVIVVGAGTGGMAVSSQLRNQGIIQAEDITIFDPAPIHYYQPGFTKIGGGIINDVRKIMYNMEKITEGFNFQNTGISKIDPDKNRVETEKGELWTYDQLVIAAGLDVKMDSIPGNISKINN